jgi:hypothetical protein
MQAVESLRVNTINVTHASGDIGIWCLNNTSS